MATAIIKDWRITRAVSALQNNELLDMPTFAAELEMDIEEATDLLSCVAQDMGKPLRFECEVVLH